MKHPVFQENDSLCTVCHIVFVRVDYDRPTVAIELIKNRQNLLGRGRIEVSRRLIRQNKERIVYQTAGDRDTLLLTT